ncbi:hypothetical protein EMIT0P171_80081 [Pseudomonas sp. IT-P171]
MTFYKSLEGCPTANAAYSNGAVFWE